MVLGFAENQYLRAWVDSGLAVDLATRNSTTGFSVSLHVVVSSSRSRLQRLVTFSISEAEFVEAAEDFKQRLWLRRIAGGRGEEAGTV